MEFLFSRLHTVTPSAPPLQTEDGLFVSVPNSLEIVDGEPAGWYFTSKEHELKRKHGYKMDDLPGLKRAFGKPSASSNSEDLVLCSGIVSTFTTHSIGGHIVKYMNAKETAAFLDDLGRQGTGVLQKVMLAVLSFVFVPHLVNFLIKTHNLAFIPSRRFELAVVLCRDRWKDCGRAVLRRASFSREVISACTVSAVCRLSRSPLAQLQVVVGQRRCSSHAGNQPQSALAWNGTHCAYVPVRVPACVLLLLQSSPELRLGTFDTPDSFDVVQEKLPSDSYIAVCTHALVPYLAARITGRQPCDPQNAIQHLTFLVIQRLQFVAAEKVCTLSNSPATAG